MSTSYITTGSNLSVVDIGINLTNRAFRNSWRPVIQRAVNAGVDRILLTGTSLSGSKEGLEMAQTWLDETGSKNLFCTVGVHPHDAKKYSKHDSTTTNNLRKLLVDSPLAVAVGECGLDFNRNFSSRQDAMLFESKPFSLVNCKFQCLYTNGRPMRTWSRY